MRSIYMESIWTSREYGGKKVREEVRYIENPRIVTPSAFNVGTLEVLTEKGRGQLVL